VPCPGGTLHDRTLRPGSSAEAKTPDLTRWRLSDLSSARRSSALTWCLQEYKSYPWYGLGHAYTVCCQLADGDSANIAVCVSIAQESCG
jgi:hypothetical protein